MKYWLALVLISFGLGIWLLETIQTDAGYVLVSLNNWTLETSFWFAAGVLLCAGLAIYLILRLVKTLIGVLLRGSKFISGHRSQLIERHYREGLLSFLTGDYKQANKQLSSVSRRNELPVVRVIVSAQALAKEGQVENALKVLKVAESKYPQDLSWLYKARIPLLMQAGRTQEAEHMLNQLKAIAPRDQALPRLAHLKLIQGQNWQQASHLLADKKLTKALAGEEIEHIGVSALRQLAEDQNTDALAIAALWEKIPKNLKSQPSLLIPYAELLFASQQHAELEGLIAFTLDKQWVPELVDLYAKLESSDARLQLKKAERWLKLHEHDQTLILCLGVLCLKNQLWGKAREYFQQVNSMGEHPRALYFLGYIAERLNDAGDSNEYYKRAAELAHH